MVDAGLVHREELHPAEAEPVRGVDLADQRLVGVQALGQPPSQLGPELDRRVGDQAGEVVEGHAFSLKVRRRGPCAASTVGSTIGRPPSPKQCPEETITCPEDTCEG
ncbi:hypothetical protein [Thermocatellispora tengchongensis]|uniref:hypothetical protein n=1 Tax=Thermocatellispora tengchongensis TaxID=1073253 RepID=UPI003645957C